MSREMMVYKGIKVFFQSMIYRDLIKMQEEWCALCNNQIQKGDTIVLIMNNFMLFPNAYVHEACLDHKIRNLEQITRDYEEFKEFTYKYRFWMSKLYDG